MEHISHSFPGKHGAALQASLNDLSADRLLEHLPPENKQLFRWASYLCKKTNFDFIFISLRGNHIL